MGWWSTRKKKVDRASTSEAASAGKRTRGKRRHAAVEVKDLAAEARLSGLTTREVTEQVGFSLPSVESWTRLYQEGGFSGCLSHPPPEILQPDSTDWLLASMSPSRL